MTENPHYVFIDFAQIVHAAFHYLGLGYSGNGNGHLNEALERQVLRKLGTISRCLKLPESEQILVLDEHSKRKKRIFPAYKANHGPHRVPVVEIARRMPNEDRIKRTFCVSPGNEADDTIATLCDRNSIGFNTIVTSDQDLWQLIGPRTRVFNPIAKHFVEPLHVETKYGKGLRSYHVPLAKSLWGDPGDNVPMAIGMSRKLLTPLVAKTDGSLEQLVQQVETNWENLTETVRLKWMFGEKQFRLNYQLVKLDSDCDIIWGRSAYEELKL